MKASNSCGIRWTVLVAVIGLIGAARCGAATIHVSPAGNDGGDGLTWAMAKKTVQAGLDAASSGDQVWVAAGTYLQSITLKAGVALSGGFAGGETELSQRDWMTNVTVLDGGWDDIRNVSVVTVLAGAAADTRIDGFTICHGKGTYSGSYWYGGGIYCASCSPTIANNTITDNFAYYGGGIACRGASPIITNNTIENNTGISAGGIHCESSSAPVISNNVIAGNSGNCEAGGICSYDSAPVISHNTITENHTDEYGGGISCQGGSPTIANNTITANTASYGAGISCGLSSVVISNNTIEGNTGLSQAGGILSLSSSLTIINNTITGNAGEGIVNQGLSATVVNTIIAFNGSGISNSRPLSLRNNCVFANGASNYSGVTDPTGTDGNISVDPQLVNAAYRGVHIQAGSPCVDAGDDTVVQAGWTDVDGLARIVGAHVDIGADEWNGTVWPSGPNVIIRVAPEGDDANDGSSWGLAKRTVQAGIDAAAAEAGEVWVKAGTYAERIRLRSCAYVYGGFAGTESDRTGRDWSRNVTVLDGNQAGAVVTADNIPTRHSCLDGFTVRNGKYVSYGGGVNCSYAHVAINNSTITGNNGAGIYCSYSSAPVIANTTICGNAGSGIACNNSSPTIVNNTITGNTAADGGGIYASNSSVTITNTIIAFNSSGIRAGGSASVLLHSNCVYGNLDYDYSGLTDPTGSNGNIRIDPQLAHPFYADVHIQAGSPCVDAGDDSVLQADWTDMDGQARRQGGHVDIGADESDGTVWPGGGSIVVRVSPQGNDASDGSSWALAKRTVQAGIDTAAAAGGEVWVQAGTYPERIALRRYVHIYGGFAGTETGRAGRSWVSNVTVLDGQQAGSVVTATLIPVGLSTLDGFTIRNGKVTGGGGGGINCSGASPMIANNTITGNSAICDYGASHSGGIWCSSSSPTIINNVITGNAISGIPRSGGGIYCDASSPMIANNTITGNVGGGIICDSSSPTIINTIITGNTHGIYRTGTGTPSLRCNCVYANPGYNFSGLTDPTGSNGNISVDPQLANSAYCGAHLRADSPCVDAGDDAVVQANWTDIDGQARIAGRHVDIGADEWDGTVWPTGPNVIVRVALEGNDANNGSSWGLAKRTVQAGIDTAAALGGEVWVKAGTYQEQIRLRSCAYVYGGFAGTESSRAGRDWSGNVTVLDGSQAGSVVTATRIGVNMCSLDGFTVRGGKAANGGGIYCSDASMTIANNTITGNTATYGGGIYCYAYSFATIIHNRILGNSASTQGGGISCSASSPTIANNMIAGNVAGAGSAIYGISSLATITNCTIAGNGTNSQYAIRFDGNESNALITNTIVSHNSAGILSFAKATLRSNCVYGNTSRNYAGTSDPTGQNGNISIDPRFVRMASAGADGKWGTADDDYGDLRLLPGSPCIDAGKNADVPAASVDLAGGKRFADDPVTVDTGVGTAPVVDIGAYEYVCGDVSGDGHIDAVDLLAVAGSWGKGTGQVGFDPRCDLNHDSSVDIIDLLYLADCWGR